MRAASAVTVSSPKATETPVTAPVLAARIRSPRSFKMSSETVNIIAPSFPFQRALLPFVDEAHCQHAQEHHHRPERKHLGLVRQLHQGHRPRKQKSDLEVEDDEQDRDQVEAHIELHPRIVEGVE